MTKIHPHLKNFIKSVVLSEMSDIGPTKSVLYKEELFKEMERHVSENLSSIQTKEDMDRIVDEKTALLKEEMSKVLSMINETMKNIPLDILRKIR